MSIRGFAPMLLVFAQLALAAPVLAQERAPWDGTRTYLSRGELQDLLEKYELSAASPGYSDVMRAQASREAERIRLRLQEGDYQVGDVLSLRVDGVADLTENFTVRTGRTILLPHAGEISLHGVLRSEAREYLTQQLARTIRDPTVHVQSLVRIAVTGDVGRPGFYIVGTEAVISDVLMEAGGPGRAARLADTRIERGDAVLWHADALQVALAAGYTIEDLGLRAGDRIHVPPARRWDNQTIRFALVTIPSLVALLLRLF
jgi:protein involved in polysaccharide export with SLBB domain